MVMNNDQEEKMKPLDILVVEDNKTHRDAAEKQLEDHNVILVPAFDYAIDYITPKEVYKENEKGKKEWMIETHDFDVILTDLLMPQGRGDCMTPANRKMGNEERAFGFPLAIIGAIQGAKYIGVITQMNHHNHPMAYTFDLIREDHEPCRLKINETTVMFFNEYLGGTCLLKDGTYTDDFDNHEEDEYVTYHNKELDRDMPVYAKNWKKALGILMENGGKNDIPKQTL